MVLILFTYNETRFIKRFPTTTSKRERILEDSFENLNGRTMGPPVLTSTEGKEGGVEGLL